MNKGTNTKEKIISASANLFNTYGYNGTSMRDIMKATGLQKGGIYNHFKNKEDIALAVFDYSYQLVLHRFKKELAKCNTHEQKLRTIIEVFKSLSTDPIAKGGCPVFNTLADSSNGASKLQEKAKKAINTLIKYVEIKIEEGIIENEFKPSVNAPDFSLLLVSSLEGSILISNVNKNNNAVLQNAKMLDQLITRFILK